LAILEWDQVGERLYETGVDHGVVYLRDGRTAAWNGLRSVEAGSDSENAPFYLDGVKYLHRVIPGDFAGKVTAFTYPDELEEVVGIEEVAPGMHYYQQMPKMFDLSYRTRIGNDLEGTDYAYKLHILYNLLAVPDQSSHQSISEQVQPLEFGWVLNGTPPMSSGNRPTLHISIDSRTADPAVLANIESILYGTVNTNPRMPSFDEITHLMEQFGSLVIVDNGDGTWTAIDQADQYITMDSPTRFTIVNADATYLDTDTYTVTTTNP
jgi:hypothetical protein